MAVNADVSSSKMPCWYYDKRELRHTPSIKAGMTNEQEACFRREGARFILQVGNRMGLRYETIATGVVFFHRFYMVHSFQKFPRHVTACCCLFLAGKVEETPKKCRDIMKIAKNLMSEEAWAEFGSDPREEVLTLERILLQTIKFDFIVEHPYTYLLKYTRSLRGDKKKLQNMLQMAWTFVNDSLCTTLCLQWEAEIIAIALMYLSGKLNKFEVTDWAGKNSRHAKWWDMFTQGITTDLLEDICHQVLDLYSANNKSDAAEASKRAASADRAAAVGSAAQTAGVTAAAAGASLGANLQSQQQPPVAGAQAAAQQTLSGDTAVSASAAPATIPANAIGTNNTKAVSKDDVDSAAASTNTASDASVPAPSTYSSYNNYSYYHPSYPPPPPPPTSAPRYGYSPYQPPPPSSGTSAPPPPSTPYQPPPPPPSQGTPSTPHPPPPPATLYPPPPVSSNTSHYSYSNTPSHPPSYRMPSGPSPYSHQPPYPPPSTGNPPPPYFPPRDSSSPYTAPQYPNRSYYGATS